MAGADGLALIEVDGLTELLGDCEVLAEGDTLDDGESERLTLADGETDDDGETELDGLLDWLLDGLTLADGLRD